MKSTSFVSLTAAFLAFVGSAFAAPYELSSSTATLHDNNLTSPFYQVSGVGAESGSAMNLYSSTLGGNADDGFWVKISFDGNPQPVLTSAFLKASNQYLLWDATDLQGFNSGTFDSIIFWNSGVSGIFHMTGGRNPKRQYQGTSHAGINGTPGVNVPDSGATLVLLGLALTGLQLAARRRSQA